jgi:hypothetical protein
VRRACFDLKRKAVGVDIRYANVESRSTFVDHVKRIGW